MRVLGKVLLALPVGLVLVLFSRRLRWFTAAGVLAFAAYEIHDALDQTEAPRESLTPAETRQLFAALLRRVKPGGPNHTHCRRLYYYSQKFAHAAGASVDSVRAAAILHDATKEDGRGDGVERFCTHGEQGADYARQTLQDIGKSDAFGEHVARSIVQHMGPCGYNPDFKDKRFMSKFCAPKDFPAPRSVEAKVLYDIDMLDLMTVDGIVKVVELRQKPPFKPEPVKDSARYGPDSAWKSVVDAEQTLITRAARDCGGKLRKHSEAFLDSVDWNRVDTVDAFKTAAAAYLISYPLPDCLPKVPT